MENIPARIKQLYKKGLSLRQIAVKINISSDTVLNIMKRNNIKRRNRIETITKYKIDSSYFDKIDNPTKAYFLGWIYSDGSISDWSLTIALKNDKDNREILSKLNKDIKSNRPIKIYKDKENYERVVLRISNKRILTNLRKIGVTKNKTYNCLFPKIPLKMQRHFIRGFFDGDGGIHKTKRNEHYRYSACIVGTETFLIKLQSILAKNKIKTTMGSGFLDKKNTVKRLIICKISELKKFMAYIYYENNYFFLERKKNKFDEFIIYRKYFDNKKCLKCNKSVFKNNLCHAHLFELKRLKNPNYTRSKKVDIKKMNEMLSVGVLQKDIAIFFGVCPATISKIINLRKNKL